MTIGYEGSTIGAVLDALLAAEVAVLIDVRALPQSRKPGFSKRQLAAGLDERGLRYVHFRDLGTPKPGRDAARRGDVSTMHRVFAAQLATAAAQAALAEAILVARNAPACLLCFEHDAASCHRSIVAGAIAGRTGQTIVHLNGRLLHG
ncbi:MAG: DUF488 domain-containing protein [Acetobacteraceae bacterium]|nr:DUF488 domain-containing protein [Acetobacteraceae bacterium]